jgi:methyltransferase (TIGR00027 family)
MALFRALESSRPAEKRLFDDRLATSFLGPGLRGVVLSARLPVAHALVTGLIDRHWPGARSSAVARTRLIDDWILDAIRSGLDQLVILGAGFDGRAYRLRAADRLRVFEVDHPATSHRKRAALAGELGELPRHVAFVATDFDQAALGAALAAGGFERQARTLFLCEGVTNYLSAGAVDATVRWIASTRPGNQLVFTYVHRKVLERPEEFEGTRRLFATLRRSREAWTFGLDPKQLASYLAERGLTLLEDLGAAEYRARYGVLPNRGYEFYRVARARIASCS